MFSPGERVRCVLTVKTVEDGHFGDGGTNVLFAGTVRAEHRPGRFVVQIDAGEAVGHEGYSRDDLMSKHGNVRLPAARLEMLMEPPRRICPICNGISGTALETCHMFGLLEEGQCMRRETEGGE
jgi:hypothetical protein